MNRIVVLSLMALAFNQVSAQTGTLTGKVQSENGRPVADAKIFAVGSADTVRTDMDGLFLLKLKPGKHIFQIESRNFADFTDSAVITINEETFVYPLLSSIRDMGVTNITVARKQKENTIAGSIRSKQLSVQMVEAISAEDFKRTTIRTSADAMKRIPGATIMEGKFANIRGMFDRYNAGYLNGAPLPSTESDRKAFSFDIIPASLLDNIVVIKSGTPDVTGDFGGGIIRINTKSIPEKLTQSFNMGFQYNSITTLRPIEMFSNSASEYFGIPGADRKLPALSGNMNISKPAEFLADESKKFNNNWDLTTTKPMLTPRFNYTIGVPFKLKNKKEIGLLMSLNYSVTQKYSDGLVNRQDLSDNQLINSYNDALFTTNVQNGGIMNLSFKLNNRHRIDWKNLYTLNYDASSTIRKGNNDINVSPVVPIEGFSNQINYNRLASTQLNGTHVFGTKQSTLTWLVNYGNTHREIPDFRIAQYATIEDTRYLVLNDFFNAGSGRFFSNLNENTFSASADMQHTLTTGKTTNNIKYGLFRQTRARIFNSREFVYGPVGKAVISNRKPAEDLGAENINASGIYLVEKTSNDADEYNGNSSLNAAFLMMEHHYPLFKANGRNQMLKLIYGVRGEQFNQYLTNAYFDEMGKKLADGGITTDLLPSMNIIAPLTGKTGLRMAYYKTVNRPEMREMAPFSFYNFNLNSEIIGNTQLKRALLHNFDVRYEIFPGKEDMFSIGAFSKRIINPIEFSLETSQPGIRTFGYQNEKSADIRGIELEMRKSLKFLGRYLAPGLFNYLSAYGNFSLIQSKVQFKQGQGTPNRSLQGQSPYVANISLFFENKKGIQASVNFNKIGSRIAYIGVAKDVQPYGSDIYEFGRSILDFQIGKNMKKAGNLKLTFGDVLRQATVFYQDINENKKYDAAGDNTLFSFTNGMTITLGYSYTF
jgi:outer membrane receptor protein involved in Fe transport